VVSRFLHLIIPVLFDVYAASMTLQIRLRSLTSILKATNFVDSEDISLLFRVNLFYRPARENRRLTNFLCHRTFLWRALLVRFSRPETIPRL